MTFKRSFQDWVLFRKLPGVFEQDFHWAGERRPGDYWENMDAVKVTALRVLKKAQEEGQQYVLFTHGWSTSHPGVTTSRSQVRKLMRSKDATPFIIRSGCIQHCSAFVAAIRPLPRKEASDASASG